MKRREFITLLGGAAAARTWPLAARAQQVGTAFRIGFLGPNPVNGGLAEGGLQIFRKELHTLGLREGQDFRIDYKNIDDPRGLSVAAAELMQSRPDILVTSGPEIVLKTAIAAKSAVPIVMIAINFDPIARGYVTSLSRPGGDITGVVFQQLALAVLRFITSNKFPGIPFPLAGRAVAHRTRLWILARLDRVKRDFRILLPNCYNGRDLGQLGLDSRESPQFEPIQEPSCFAVT